MELMLLPSELLIDILIDLDFRNLLRCREVCTRFKTLIDEDFRARYTFELAVAGMEDGPSSMLTTAERLSILRIRQNAWSKLAWTAKERIPLYVGAHHVWKLQGNVLVQSEGNRTLHFKQIPSAIRGIEGTEWVIPDGGCDIKEIGMDPAQDLLILIEDFEDDSQFQLTYRIHLHLRSLSTGAPHPAGHTTGILIHDPQPGIYSYRIHISEGYLGILMFSEEFGDPSELLIWEWEIGTLRLYITGPELLSWAFLTSHFVLIAHGGSGFRVNMEHSEENATIQGPSGPHFVVIDLESLLSSNPITLSEVDYICAFRYPPLEDNLRVSGMFIRSDPGANWCPSPALGVPFSVSREDRLFVITLYITNVTRYEDIVLHSVVPASTFLRPLALLPPRETRHEFAWAEWGLHGSRLMRELTRHVMDVCYTYGTTVVTTEDQVDLDTRTGAVRKCAIMRDFNQLAIRRRAESGAGPGGKASGDEDEEQGVRVVAEATVFEPASLFKEEVATALPYVERTFYPFQDSEEEDGHFDDAVMLAEDALVVVLRKWVLPFRCHILSF